MAKDPASTRIPRLDGVSRIPQPSCLRPPTIILDRNAQSGRPTSAFLAPRATSLTGLRPPHSLNTNLKKSSSGDRINNAVNIVSKRTTNAFKKFFTKPEKTLTHKQYAVTKRTPADMKMNASERKGENHQEMPQPTDTTFECKLPMSTPKPLIRSDTFIRDQDDVSELLGITHDVIMVQSTPMTQYKANTNEHSTELMQTHSRQALFAEHTTTTLPPLPEGQSQLGETITLDSSKALQQAHTGFGRTIALESPQALATDNREVLSSNTTTAVEPALGQTVTLARSSACSTTGGSAIKAQLCKQTTYDMSPTKALYASEIEGSTAVPATDVCDATAMKSTQSISSLMLDRSNMNLPLNSTLNTERLLDITSGGMLTTPREMQHLNLTRDFIDSPMPDAEFENRKNTTQLLYMTPAKVTNLTPDLFSKCAGDYAVTVGGAGLPPLKCAKSELSLHLDTRSPDHDEPMSEPMDVDATLKSTTAASVAEYNGRQQQNALSLQELNKAGNTLKPKSRFSFGLDLTHCTLDCSIELCDISLSSTMLSQSNYSNINSKLISPTAMQQQQLQQQQILKKQNSFDLDESLGILTPEQMKEFPDSTLTNNINNLSENSLGNLDNGAVNPQGNNNSNNNNHNNSQKMSFHAMRFDQTPSPEDLPLDPIEVKTDIAFSAVNAMQQQRQQQLQQQHMQSCSSVSTEPTSLSCESTEPSNRTDDRPLSKCGGTKISNSFITSVTSVTSLDTGYQGDGEMSRPASRGANDHSPSQRKCAVDSHVSSRQPSFNQQQQQQENGAVRRQDPMTDSDFFTESDADDVHHRGDRRAQIIDGQLYGAMLLQPAAAAASVLISEDPQMEDSCMESSGIFTDIENRCCDDDLALLRRQDTQDIDMSPDGDSTGTVKSNRSMIQQQENEIEVVAVHGQGQHLIHTQQQKQQQQQLSDSQNSSSSYSNERLSIVETEIVGAATLLRSLSNRTSYCSVGGEDGSDESGTQVIAESCDSLEEAFAESGESSAAGRAALRQSTQTNTIATDAQQQQMPNSVAHVSSERQHASSSFTTFSTTTVPTTTHVTGVPSSPPSSIKLMPVAGCNKVSAKLSCDRALSASSTPPRQRKAVSPRTTASSASPTSSCASSSFRKSPNKWDAVMNKIASNKLLLKKNYSDVKSKVSTRVSAVSGGGTGALRNASSSVNVSRVTSSAAANSIGRVFNSSNSSPTNAGNGKRLLPIGAIDRISKNGQKGSQSDLSHRSGSPKSTPKSTIRAAKKRDMRNLSISPTDLGPPPKTQQTANGASTRPKPVTANLTDKRSIQNIAAVVPSTTTTTTTTTGATAAKSMKSSSPHSKKFTLINTRRLDVKSTASPLKAPLKDHNRLVPQPVQQQQQQQQQLPCVAPAKHKANGSTKPRSPTENHENLTTFSQQQLLQQHQHYGNNKSNGHKYNVTAAAATAAATTTTLIRSASQAAAPVFGTQQHAKKISNALTSTAAAVITAAKSATTAATIAASAITTTATTTAAASATTRTISAATTRATATILTAATAPTFERLTKATKVAAAAAATTTTITAATNVAVKSSSPPLQSSGHTCQQTESPPCVPEVGAIWESRLLNAQQQQQLQHLQRHLCNGRLNFLSLERYLQQTAENQQRSNKGIEAMGVLLQYLVFDMDAFACSTAKYEKVKAKESLTRTLQQLDEVKNVCSELQDQLCEKESFYSQREEELQTLQRCELDKVKQQFCDEIATLKFELHNKDSEQNRLLENYRLESDNKLMQKQQELSAAEEREKKLIERLSEFEKREEQLNEKLQKAEDLCAQSVQRESELLEKLRALDRELETLRENKASNERDLKEKLNLSQEEIAVLRNSSRRSVSNESASSSSPRNSSSASTAAANEITRLQSEAESLRCVLELKQKELSKLTKHNEELLRDADERNGLHAKISLLEARNEMLYSEFAIKSDKEKDFLRQIDEMQKAFNHETVKRTRLSYDNEALQWQLKQRSEQLHIVEAKLQELSQEHNSSLSSPNRSTVSGSALHSVSVNGDDASMPAMAAMIKGVIEKTDSVSWVLEMDDDTPEAAASKMVKRAGSFRSIERSPTAKRLLSLSANAANASTVANTSGFGTKGPIPLSQSMSAASVIRQHSIETVANARIRSKSVSVKSPEPVANRSAQSRNKRLGSYNSTNSNSRRQELAPSAWNEPLSSSSPYGARPRCSTMKANAPSEECFRRTNVTRKLITCDTSTLNSGERLEMRSLPAHPCMPNLKTQKKSPQIRESAGEAMVSGTNSEDEGCSHSSDEVVSSSTASMSSATSGSSISLNHMKGLQHMSLEEEVLLLHKINSLNGTPMEVSWSDDADVFVANGASV